MSGEEGRCPKVPRLKLWGIEAARCRWDTKEEKGDFFQFLKQPQNSDLRKGFNITQALSRISSSQTKEMTLDRVAIDLIGVIIAILAGIISIFIYEFIIKNEEKNKKRVIKQKTEKNKPVMIRKMTILSIIFIIIFLSLIQYIFQESLYNVEIVEKNTLMGYNKEGQFLWAVKFNSSIVKAIVDDINQDGSNEVVVGTQEPGTDPGILYALDGTTGKILDAYDTWRPPIYIGGASEKFNVADFLIDDLAGNGRKEIAVASRDVYWHVSRLAVLTFDKGRFHELSNFWNPGLLYEIYSKDLNNDKIKELILRGQQ